MPRSPPLMARVRRLAGTERGYLRESMEEGNLMTGFRQRLRGRWTCRAPGSRPGRLRRPSGPHPQGREVRAYEGEHQPSPSSGRHPQERMKVETMAVAAAPLTMIRKGT